MLNLRIIFFIKILLLAIFGLVLCSVLGKGIYIDGMINNYFQNNYTENGKQFFIIIADIGDKGGVMTLALLVSAYFYYKKYISKIIVLISSMVLGVGSSTLVKYLVGRERPSNMIIEYGGYSFPSGHSVFAILFYGLLVCLFWDIIKNKTLKYAILILAIIMGILVMISRVYLSVHYASDVFAGATLGFFWLLFGVVLYRKLKK